MPAPILLPRRRWQSDRPPDGAGQPDHPELLAAQGRGRGRITENEFLPFQGEIDSPHGGVHVRVGGDMGAFDYAGYDPIFWMHHANIDRHWARWQRAHDGVVVPRLDYSLPGVDMTVERTVDPPEKSPRLRTMSRTNASNGSTATTWRPVSLPSTSRGTQYSVADLADGFDTAILELHNVGHPLDGTREIRVFINQPDADAETETEGNDHYAGSRVLLGKTMCYGEDGPLRASDRPAEVRCPRAATDEADQDLHERDPHDTAARRRGGRAGPHGGDVRRRRPGGRSAAGQRGEEGWSLVRDA